MNDLLAILLNVFDGFPQDLLKHVKNFPLYLDLLDTFKALLTFLHFLLKRLPRIAAMMTDFFVEKFPILLNLHVFMLRNLPPTSTLPLRKELLTNLKSYLADIANLER